MSSIQQGIQSAHAQMELFVKYKEQDLYDYASSTGENPPEHVVKASTKANMLYDWAKHHKTMIVLNGGYLSTMKEALIFLDVTENPYPFAEFYESEEAMGGMLTNIAIVLPEKIYQTSEFMRKRMIDNRLNVDTKLPIETSDEVEETMASFGVFSDYEIELCSFMNNFVLAN